jgi:alkylhydroperoxidase family enzyme
MTTTATESLQPQPKGRTKMPPRLRQPRRSEIASEEIQRVFDDLFGDRDPVVEPGTKAGTPGNWWTTMAIEPGIFHLIEERHAWQYSTERRLAPVLRELAITRAGWARGSQFVYSQHVKTLRRLGVEEAKIVSLPSWSSADCFTSQERALLGYVDDLVLGSGRVPDERFTQLRDVLSDVEILELTYMTCTYDMSSTMALALRLEYDDRPDPIVEVTSVAGPQPE